MRILKGIAIAGIIVGAIWLFGVDITSFAPPEAFVYCDSISKTYFSPPLLEQDQRIFVARINLHAVLAMSIPAATDAEEILTKKCGNSLLHKVWVNLTKLNYSWEPPEKSIIVCRKTIKEVKQLGYSPDSMHRNAGGFSYTRDKFTYYLECLGNKESRWNKDGEWNW